MPHFNYTARDKSGASFKGGLEAPHRRDALRILSARGLTPLRIEEDSIPDVARRKPTGAHAAPSVKPPKNDSSKAQNNAQIAARPRRRERLPFLQALYDLTASGLSAGEAVRLLSVRLKEPALRSLCQGLWEHLSEGAPLSRAMAAFPDVFDASTLNLIDAGEATGSLNETLTRIIAHLNEQRALRRLLVQSLAYPVFMLMVATGVVLFFLLFLLPRLQGLLSSLGGKMPTSTQLLISLSGFSMQYGLFVAAAAVFLGISFWRWRATEVGRIKSDAWLLRLPFIGDFLTSQTVLSISQTLSVLLENGITTAEALKMTEKQISNRVHRIAFGEAIARVLEGESMSVALGRTGCFPELVLDRLTVGENTGNVVPSLKDIAKNYQARISEQLNLFTRGVASTVLFGVFSLVGFIAYAIVSAVFQLSASFRL